MTQAAATPSLRPLVKQAAGLTLIELLVVLVLLALIASFAVPVFNASTSQAALRGAAREIAAGLRLARSDALAARRETVVLFDVEQRAFRVDRDPRMHALPRGVDMKLTGAQSDIENEHVGAIRFFPDGGSNGGRVTIASGERKFDVDIDWLTGRVAIND